MIYGVVEIFPCDLGDGGSSGQPGIAWWPVGWPARCVLWPAGGGAEVPATLKLQEAGRPGSLSSCHVEEVQVRSRK